MGLATRILKSVVNPVSGIKKLASAFESISKTGASKTLNIAGNIGRASQAVVGAVLGAGTPAIAGRVASVATSAIKNPGTTLKIVGAGTLGAGILSASPTAQKAVVNAPKNLYKTGEKIGGIVEGNDVNLNPIDGLRIGETVAGVGGGIVGATALYLYDRLDGKNQKEASNNNNGIIGTNDIVQPETKAITMPIASSSPIATTPQGIATENINLSKSKKSRHRAFKMPPIPIVRVNNRVIVNNKNYLKNGNN